MSLLFADIYEAIRSLRMQKGVSEKDILKYIQSRVGGSMKVGNYVGKMFECKYPLLEVIQAIEKIRESKGPTETEVLNYVRQHVREPDDPVKVLKTITALKKLVDEGVLIQKGKRYMFSPHAPESSGGEECDEEDNEGGGGKEESNLDCEGDRDEDDDDDGDGDDDDDDDDDDEEEESDDESSDECDEKDIDLEENSNQEPREGGEDNNIAAVLKHKHFKCPSRSPESIAKKLSSANAEMSKCAKSAQEKKSGGGKSMLKGGNVIDQRSGDGKNKGGETIAFCTRDFIDSQYRPPSQTSSHVQSSKSEEMPQDSLSPRSEKMTLGGVFPRSKRASRTKRGQTETYRSRSPIRGIKPEMFDSIRMDHADEMRSISSQLFHEQADADMEGDGGKGTDEGNYDGFRHRSPVGPPPPNSPGVHVSREESCCSNFDVKNQTEIKIEPNFEEYSLKKNTQGELSQLKCKENIHKRGNDGEKRPDNNPHKRGMSSDDDKNMSDDARASLCSICEKKKRNS